MSLDRLVLTSGVKRALCLPDDHCQGMPYPFRFNQSAVPLRGESSSEIHVFRLNLQARRWHCLLQMGLVCANYLTGHRSSTELRVMTWMDEQIGQLEMSELICLILEPSPTTPSPEPNHSIAPAALEFKVYSFKILEFLIFMVFCLWRIIREVNTYSLKIPVFLKVYDLSKDSPVL